MRPVLCVGAGGRDNVKEKETKRPLTTTKANASGKGKDRAIDPDTDNSGGTLSFCLFALHDLRAGEEVVLVWERDDGNAVHSLPVLLKTRGMFP